MRGPHPSDGSLSPGRPAEVIDERVAFHRVEHGFDQRFGRGVQCPRKNNQFNDINAALTGLKIGHRCGQTAQLCCQIPLRHAGSMARFNQGCRHCAMQRWIIHSPTGVKYVLYSVKRRFFAYLSLKNSPLESIRERDNTKFRT